MSLTDRVAILASQLRDPRWARREIARLDPVADARRIVHLLFEVRYGSPVFVHTLFSLAFARQVAVPEIGRVLYRGGKGAIITDTRKRNDDTLVFFGLLFRHGDGPEGRRVIGRMNRMHARFPITNTHNLYTLATLALLPTRFGRQLLGRELLTDHEALAVFTFWRRMGELMGIADLPATPAEFLAWVQTYERAHLAYSPEGAAVTAALAAEFAERWLPAARAVGQRAFYALFDEPLRAAHRLGPVRPLEAAAAQAVVRAFLGARRWLPDPADRDLLQSFGRRYPAAPDPDSVGPRRLDG